MRTVIFNIALIFLAVTAFAQNSAISSYLQGNDAYRSENYAGAIEAYEQAIEAGADDYRVFFNLGNALYRERHIGKAILNWERAKILDPRNEDILENLDFIRSTQVDIVRESENGPNLGNVYENTFIGFVYGFLSKFSAREFVNMLVILSILGSICLTIWISNRSRSRRVFFVMGIVIWALFLAVLIPFAIKLDNAWETDKAIVISSGAEIRSASYENSQLLYTFQEGMEVAVLEIRGDYAKVLLHNGEEGWLRADYIERVILEK